MDTDHLPSTKLAYEPEEPRAREEGEQGTATEERRGEEAGMITDVLLLLIEVEVVEGADIEGRLEARERMFPVGEDGMRAKEEGGGGGNNVDHNKTCFDFGEGGEFEDTSEVAVTKGGREVAIVEGRSGLFFGVRETEATRGV